MKIITLTLNPAFDVHCNADGFAPYKENIVEIISRDAGGKGVNISRALSAFSTENRALVVMGEENGDEFYRMLLSDGLSVTSVYTKGRIRENITLHERENPETRISFGGFAVNGDIIRKIKTSVGSVDENTVITFTGSLPKGIETADVLALLGEYKSQGAKIVIDSRSVTLSEIKDFKPWLIKPNKDEIEKYIGKQVEKNLDAAKIASEIQHFGVENVMISLGGDGAVLATNEGCFIAEIPKIKVLSTIGAGDSTIAGFIDGTKRGYGAKDLLRRATAFGTAACMTEGTRPPQKSDVEKIEKLIKVTELLAHPS